MWLNGLFGVVGGVVLYLAASPLLTQIFKMPEVLRGEILGVLPWVAASVPLATMSGVLSGTLEGCDRFLVVNFLQVLGSILFKIVPLLAVLVWGPELTVIIPAAVLTRTISALSLAIAAVRALPAKHIRLPQRIWARKLVGYGAWVSVTTLVSPLLLSLDRMMIGSVLGARSVAYYSVPYNLVNKVAVLPGALVRAMFPRLSNQSSCDAKELTTRAVRLIGIGMTLVIAPAILLIGPFLKLWVGAEVAGHATPVAQIILLGLWVNSLAQAPFNLLQAQGHPDVVAKFHVLELVPFVGLLVGRFKQLWLNGSCLGLERKGNLGYWSVVLGFQDRMGQSVGSCFPVPPLWGWLGSLRW